MLIFAGWSWRITVSPEARQIGMMAGAARKQRNPIPSSRERAVILRRPCSEGGAADRHRGRQQPPGALPSQAEALALPLKAFPGWFLCIRCGRCGETRMVNEAQTPWQDVRLVYVLRRLRHADCGGEAASVELHNAVEGGQRLRRLRRIVLRGG
jgi:hypothetical protein